MSADYDKQILDCVAASDRPLRHRDIAELIAPGNNRAWSQIGGRLTMLYRAGLLSREKTDGRYWHYMAGDGAPVGQNADLIYAQQLRARIDELERDNARLREGVAAAYARAAMIADEVADSHAKIAVPQGRFTADYRAGAVDAARHVAHLIRKAQP